MKIKTFEEYAKDIDFVYLDANLFTWDLWRAGTISDLDIPRNRRWFIRDNIALLRKYAIAYCDASHLGCRPKRDQYAIMFQKDDLMFWTHFYKEDFELIKGDLK